MDPINIRIGPTRTIGTYRTVGTARIASILIDLELFSLAWCTAGIAVVADLHRLRLALTRLPEATGSSYGPNLAQTKVHYHRIGGASRTGATSCPIEDLILVLADWILTAVEVLIPLLDPIETYID